MSAWRRWRAKVRFLGPVWRTSGVFYRDLVYDELKPAALSSRTELPPYDGIAELWHDHVRHSLPDYPSYLAALARDKGVAVRSVLDLACGDGTMTTRLTTIASDVVGLDTSEAMLARARMLNGGQEGLTFVRADFRDFGLGRRFDAITCASNSLNYVSDIGDLARTFRAVSDHLNPSGLFLFDTFTERGMKWLSGRFFHSFGQPGRRFVVGFTYDCAQRVETSVALVSRGYETHRRVPIDPSDVATAIKGTNLEIEDQFAVALLPRRWTSGLQCFFVLRKLG